MPINTVAQKQTEAILPRRKHSAPAPWTLAHQSPGALLRSEELVASSLPRLLSRVESFSQSGPETCYLEMEGIALREMGKAPLPSEEGQVGNPWFRFVSVVLFCFLHSSAGDAHGLLTHSPSPALHRSCGATNRLITHPPSPALRRSCGATNRLITHPPSPAFHRSCGAMNGLITHRPPTPPLPTSASINLTASLSLTCSAPFSELRSF
nr:uncharacterized protein LOC129440472 [Misgurnus anguillicaudatus]XP_055055827.1 uncharacterized protein LOC129440475 [Misgurnus anguillicaudatus]